MRAGDEEDRIMKTYSCPSCGARIALRDINVKSDLMLCRACGKTTSCSRYLQREAAGKALGEPPKRVRVIHEEATSDRPREDRIEWRYGLWGVLLGVFLMCAWRTMLRRIVRASSVFRLIRPTRAGNCPSSTRSGIFSRNSSFVALRRGIA